MSVFDPACLLLFLAGKKSAAMIVPFPISDKELVYVSPSHLRLLRVMYNAQLDGFIVRHLDWIKQQRVQLKQPVQQLRQGWEQRGSGVEGDDVEIVRRKRVQQQHYLTKRLAVNDTEGVVRSAV